MNARLYDYCSGVFTSADPLFADMQRAGGLNAYGYVYGNPFSFVDPSGKAGRSTLGQTIRNARMQQINFTAGQNYTLGGGLVLSTAGPIYPPQTDQNLVSQVSDLIVDTWVQSTVDIVSVFASSSSMTDSRTNENDGDPTIYRHYTSEENYNKWVASGWEASGVLRRNNEGLVYVTQQKLSHEEAFYALFMGAPGYESKGSHLIEFTISQDTVLEGRTQRNELVHRGSMRVGKQIEQVLYSGENPYVINF